MRALAVITSTLLVVVLVACHSSTTSPTSGYTLNVVLTDSPFTDAKAVLVSFSEMSAHITGGSFMPLSFTGGASSRTCDLKKLVGAQDVLGTGSLPTGHYTELRLVVSTAVVYLDNPTSGAACGPTMAAPSGRSAGVTVPSGEIHLNREFDVKTTVTTMTLDFFGDQSITLTGNGQYVMNPVIAVVSVQ